MRRVSKKVSRAQKHVVALCCFSAMTLTFVIAVGSPTIPLEFDLRIVEADSLVVVKGLGELRVYVDGQVQRVYCVGLGVNADGPKTHRGDRRTPEGLYAIDWRNPESRYYKALHISYPNAADRAQARKRGRHPGGNILIHGRPNEAAHLPEFDWATNWTDGCIAVDNSHMDELWSIVPDGCPIRILP